MKNEVLRMERVTYVDKGVTLLEDFNLQVFEGEILGLNPVNGHGLKEFLEILQTNLPLYDGYVYYCGEKVNSWKQSRKNINRIGFVEAESRLVERMTVADNIFVLKQSFKQEIIQNRLLEKQLSPFLDAIDVSIKGNQYVEKLSTFERVIVELLRSITRGYHLIVLREINTLLNGEELKKFHEIIKYYAAKGVSFIYISLHGEELLEICNRIALFSNGRIHKVLQESQLNIELFREYSKEFDKMVRYHYENRKFYREDSHPLAQIRQDENDDFREVNINIYSGECLVIQSPNEQIFQIITNFLSEDYFKKKGHCYVDGKEVKIQGNRDFAVIKSDPTESMIFAEMNYMDNLCMGLSQRVPNLWMNKKIRESIKTEYSDILGEEVFDKTIDELSEKEKYQLVYMRILLQKPKIVFCIQPFKGADYFHRLLCWKMLEMLLDKGITVVIFAINLADSLSLADRLVRIEADGTMSIIDKKDFGSLLVAAPWLDLYRDTDVKNDL